MLKTHKSKMKKILIRVKGGIISEGIFNLVPFSLRIFLKNVRFYNTQLFSFSRLYTLVKIVTESQKWNKKLHNKKCQTSNIPKVTSWGKSFLTFVWGLDQIYNAFLY